MALTRLQGIHYLQKRTYANQFAGGYVDSGYDAVVTDFKQGIDFRFVNGCGDFTIRIRTTDASIECELTAPGDPAQDGMESPAPDGTPAPGPGEDAGTASDGTQANGSGEGAGTAAGGTQANGPGEGTGTASDGTQANGSGEGAGTASDGTQENGPGADADGEYGSESGGNADAAASSAPAIHRRGDGDSPCPGDEETSANPSKKRPPKTDPDVMGASRIRVGGSDADAGKLRCLKRHRRRRAGAGGSFCVQPLSARTPRRPGTARPRRARRAVVAVGVSVVAAAVARSQDMDAHRT